MRDMKRSLRLVFLLAIFLFSFSRAEAQDEQYVRIYNMIQEGDTLRDGGRPDAAIEKYSEAVTALQQFQRYYPDWNSNVVKFRLNYLASNIAEISARRPAPGANAGSVSNAPAGLAGSGIAAETAAQMKVLQNQIHQLQSDNSNLEAKLKEALRVQPANVDPGALARAEEQLKTLQKENALLKVNLAERPVQPAAVDSKTLEQLKQQLAEANRKVSQQTERAAALTAEKAELQKKIESLIPAAWNATNLETARKELEEANRKLAAQNETASRLALEKTALQERVKTLMKENEAAVALRSENEILKRQLAELKAKPAAESEKAARELAEAKAQLAALQSDQNVLRLENAALTKQLKESLAAAPATNAPATVVDTARVKELERERDELQKKWEAAQKDLAALRNAGDNTKVAQLQDEIQLLRTRLAVMETQKMPYTEEEAALIKKTEAQVVESTVKKPSRDLPSGSMELVREAQQDFAARRFEDAEQKYQQVLKKDAKNVYTLANLAAIQIEMNHYDQAETNIQQALSVSPDDAYSLSLLGFLRFRQNRFDDALDALGRAAKLDPQNPEIQNYLGLTLGQKGMRNAAESAFRKAITLDPNYGSAHYNLAVIYLTEKPRQVELARLHYRKAIAAGMSPSVDMERMLGNTNSVAKP